MAKPKLRSVDTHFWDDTFIVDLDPIEKLLFLYLLTNRASTLAGCFELSLRQIAFDVGIEREMVVKILGRFEGAGKIIFKDGWIILLNFLRHQNFNPNMGIAAARELNAMPVWVRRLLVNHIEAFPNHSEWLKNVTITEPLPNDSQTIAKQYVEYEREDEVEVEREKKKNLQKKENSQEKEINTWLDAIAPIVGAKSRKTMPTLQRWSDTVEKLVREQRDLTEFLPIVQSELKKNSETPQYFTPDSCLKAFQCKSANGHKPKFLHSL